ncbi:MAG: methyltransferase [Candidatus Dormibacteria bacterium]
MGAPEWPPLPSDLSFLSPPGQVSDWRLSLLFDTAVGAGVLGALPGTEEDVARSLHLDGYAVRVLLDAVAAWGIVTRDPDGGYALGPDAPGRDAGVTLRHHSRAIRRWSASLDRRLRGLPEEDRPDMGDPEVFLDALAVGARRAAPGIVDRCLARFPGARSVLDLGGCHGEYSLEFVRRGLRATMQDMPTMIDLVRSRGTLAEAGVDLVAGSFFDAVPEGPFDLAFCAGITHTFDGEHNLQLYRRLRPVVTAEGGIAVVTFFRNRQPLADVFAVQMLVNGSGGDSHGEEDYRRWLTEAAFRVDDAPVDVDNRPQSILFAC